VTREQGSFESVARRLPARRCAARRPAGEGESRRLRRGQAERVARLRLLEREDVRRGGGRAEDRDDARGVPGRVERDAAADARGDLAADRDRGDDPRLLGLGQIPAGERRRDDRRCFTDRRIAGERRTVRVGGDQRPGAQAAGPDDARLRRRSVERQRRGQLVPERRALR